MLFNRLIISHILITVLVKFILGTHGFVSIPHHQHVITTQIDSKPVQSVRNRLLKYISMSSSNDNYNDKSDDLETWRIFGIEVHPDDLVGTDDDKLLAKSVEKQSSSFGKRYLSESVVESLIQTLQNNMIKNYKKSSKKKKRKTENSNTYIDSEMIQNVNVIRRSLDARRKPRTDGKGRGPRYTYVLDFSLKPKEARRLQLKHQPGRTEKMNTK